MYTKPCKIRWQVARRRAAGLVLALLVALTAGGCMDAPLIANQGPGRATVQRPAQGPAGRLPVQPEVLALAAAHPQAMLPIIVQKRSAGSAPEARVAALGGAVTQDLHLINGFAAELPAAALVQFAQSAGIRWISLDAPMVPTGAAAGTGMPAPFVPGTAGLQPAFTTGMAAAGLQPAFTTGMAAAGPQPAFTTWATAVGAAVPGSFLLPENMVDSPLGAAGTYGRGNGASGSFKGFSAEVTAGYRIAKVEAVVVGYAAAPIANPLKFAVYIDGSSVSTAELAGSEFKKREGVLNAGPVYVDVTGSRTWLWGDFSRQIELAIDQSTGGPSDWIYYDAVGLRIWTEPGADSTATPPPLPTDDTTTIDLQRQVNVYNKVLNVEALWTWNRWLQGRGVGVAVIDSGVEKTGDLKHLRTINVNFSPGYHDSKDRFGHGTFVASVLAGSGKSSGGIHVGVAPRVKLANVRVSDDSGKATAADVVAGLQWVYEHAARYNIRVVNLSLNSSVAASYLTDPLCAAVEMLWLRGIVVVVSAGNNGTATLYPPANDPFVITVGATDDRGTADLADDQMAGFSGYGVTEAGTPKPDLVAPGRNIIGYMPYNKSLRMPGEHPTHRVTDSYFRMSGTSVAAPMVSGAVAILLQSDPYLTPNQVKRRLMATANRGWPGYDPQRSGAGYVDALAAVWGSTYEEANAGLPVSRLLWDSLAFSTAWSSVNWNSVNWNSVNWNSVNWNSVNWNSVNWNSDYWESAVVGAAGAEEIPAVTRLFELLEEQPAAAPAAGNLYLPAIQR